jgi:hypothetical protein
MDTSRIASLFGGDPQETPAALAAALATPAAPGHFDELRGSTADGAARSRGLPARPWARFFENLGSDGFDDLDRRSASLQRQIREHGTTYNVHADAQAPQRPWSLATRRTRGSRSTCPARGWISIPPTAAHRARIS